MIKTLFRSVREYKWAALGSPICMIGEVYMEVQIPTVLSKIVDLGVDVSPQAFVEAVRSHPECKIVGLSALLTTTMDSMAATVKALEEARCGEAPADGNLPLRFEEYCQMRFAKRFLAVALAVLFRP